jgi:HEAT repeat protein
MTAAKKLNEKNIEINQLTEITELRDYYHSVELSETSQAIAALKKIASVDATRELTQLYVDCLWRKIKIEIISALGAHTNQRSLEFLFDIAKSDADLSLSHVAIESLGQTQHILAARFLENLYQHGHKTKKTAIVSALVKFANTSCLELFAVDLKKSLETKDFTLAKNLIYAMGELRSSSALELLKTVLNGPYPKDIQLSAVSSIGKISRQPSDLAAHQDKFKNDAFEFQIFQQAQNQIVFRSEWKLEDYLNKLFQGTNSHRNLPLELNSFSSADVFAGLEMFLEPKNEKKIADTLSFLNFKETISWYPLFFKDMSSTNAELVSVSLSSHFSENCKSVIDQLALVDVDFAHKAAVTCLPSAEIYFKNFISSDEYKNGSDVLKIKTLNHLVDLLSIHQHDSKLISSMAKFLENELQVEASFEVKNRLIRALAQAKLPQNKIFSVLKSFLPQVQFTKSILFYLEHHNSHQCAVFLKDNFAFFEGQSSSHAHFLKALAAQEVDFFEFNLVKKFMASFLQAGADLNLKVLALKFLSRHSYKEFKLTLFGLLNDRNQQVVLNTVIALKAITEDDIPDILQPLLSSKSESIKGRTLDAILWNNSLRAKRIAVDFLKDNLDNIECCEKIIRHLSKTDIKSDYFYNAISQIIKNHPQHALLESFQDLLMKLQTDLHENNVKSIPSAADLVAIDKEILRKLPRFNEYDEAVKVSLRSAEVPFSKPELFDKFVDKSVCILGFTKAIDIFLEKQFGKKILLPKLESRLHEFQNVIHILRLNEDYPDASRVVVALGLEKHFTAHSLPVHKMTLIGKGLLSSKIINEQFKILDGLRAWAITFLLFTRKYVAVQKPLISVQFDENVCVDIAKKLMWLQDLRNPVAHRQTLTKLDEIKEIRDECYRILNNLEKIMM